MRGLTNSDVNFLSPYSGEFIHHTHFSTILGVVALQRDYSAILSQGDPCHLKNIKNASLISIAHLTTL